MQQNETVSRRALKQYSLKSMRLIVQEKRSHHNLAIYSQNLEGEIQMQARPNLVQIKFKISFNETLNECLKKSVVLFDLWTKNHKLSVNLTTREGEYCFQQMNYFMFLQVLTNRAEDQKQVKIINQNIKYKRTQGQVVIQLHRCGNIMEEFYKTNEIVLSVGGKLANTYILSELSDFCIQTFETNQVLNCAQTTQNKFLFVDKEYSRPLGLFTHSSQIYKSLGINENCTIQNFETYINTLPSHTVAQLEKQNKLYICHDMKGGYKEDLNFSNNIIPHEKIYNVAYRSFHLQQAEIFNYFSHHNITVPTKHWRMLCKKYDTKCLGTFITERQDYDQNMLNSKQFALFLIAIAKKCKFDGYLINIERKIKNITFFRQWIDYLTKKIHHYIPNSLIIWYDSISPKDGIVKYQNGLTKQNYQFYHLTDGIFTNYWWNQERLKESCELKSQNKRKVYIGNDCFGRNTYGGGKFDIYKAANKILQTKNQLSIALFAPGYTYQNGGQYINYLYHLNQLCMYKGVSSQTIHFSKRNSGQQKQLQWKQSKADRSSGGWQRQDQWHVCSYHYNAWCQKSVKIKFKGLQQGQSAKIVFVCLVASTPPLFNSPYKVVLQLIDENNIVLRETDVNNLNNCKRTTQNNQVVVEQLIVSSQMLGNRDISVRIIVMGKSRQNWGGFYGPRFKNQVAYVMIYQNQRHWVSKLPINQVMIDSPFHSYFNAGYGQKFHYQGTQLQPYYNFLADMDTAHTHIINHPLQTEFDFQQSFIGGSSLKVSKQAIKLLKIIIPSSINLQEEYYIQIVAKKARNVKLAFKYLSKNEEERVFSANLVKLEDLNDWNRYTFRLATSLKQLKNSVRSIIEISSVTLPYFIGQVKFMKGKGKQLQLVKCTLQVSKQKIQTSKYYFNLTLSAKTYKRLLVLIGKVGIFAYFEQGTAVMKNLPLQKCESFELQVIDTDESLENKTIAHKVVDSYLICDLIFNGSISF